MYWVVVFGHSKDGFRYRPLLSHRIMVSVLIVLGGCVVVGSSGVVVVVSDVQVVFEVGEVFFSTRMLKRFVVGIVQVEIVSVGGFVLLLSFFF
jgi:hypothetical protein